MAVMITYTPEQRKAQGETLAKLFRLPDAKEITAEWHLESHGRGGEALLEIHLLKIIDARTVTAIINGLPLPESSS